VAAVNDPTPDQTHDPGGGAAVVVEGLSYAYPDGHRALDEVSLTVEPGERVAILGPNGSGKTTLVLHLNGILTPTSGTVTVDGLAVAGADLPEVRRRVGIVFQDPDDQLFMPTAGQDVAFGPANHGVSGAELDRRVADALALVGMAGATARAAHHLSLGQRRRVALATVLSMDPTVLVFDEPSANLDPQARRELADVVIGLARTTIVVTHDLLYAAELCPRSVILDGGRIVADGPTLDLLADTARLARHRLELPRAAQLVTDRSPAANRDGSVQAVEVD
jgi:cobalt transport protein ATP-binding subunit